MIEAYTKLVECYSKWIKGDFDNVIDRVIFGFLFFLIVAITLRLMLG